MTKAAKKHTNCTNIIKQMSVFKNHLNYHSLFVLNLNHFFFDNNSFDVKKERVHIRTAKYI